MINTVKNILYLSLISCFVFPEHDTTSGLTTLFEHSGDYASYNNLNWKYDYLKDMRIGLIINHTSKVPGRPNDTLTTYQLFKDANLNVVRIFSPEHGISGDYAAGTHIPSTSEVVSLYGKNKAPRYRDLKDIDVLIFDIQDIGVRYYTYISTMTLAMEKAAQNNVKFIVLDRINPLSRRVEGPVLNPDFSSFVGMHPVPVRHGMTTGEMALFIKENKLIKSADKLELDVVKGRGWHSRDYSHGEGRCDPSFEQTSPNIPHLDNALMYTGTCLLEGTNLSEGRGTDFPFMLFGAPWLDSEKIIKELEKYNFEEVRFAPHSFIPNKSKYNNIKCNGIRIIINQYEKTGEPLAGISPYSKHYSKVNPFRIGVAIIDEIYKAHPNNFEFKTDFFDKLYGSSDLRLAILESKNIDELIEKNEKDIVEFKKLRKKVLLYK